MNTLKSFYYQGLGMNKRTYEDAVQCFAKRGKSFAVGGGVQLTELFTQVLGDYPEFFYVGQEFKIMTSLMRREALPVYLYSPIEIPKIQAEIEREAACIISESINEYQSDYDKVRSLHDYLKKNLQYDTEAAESNAANNPRIAQAHNIVGAFLHHKCVCEGFAKAMKYLCDKIGVECWVVTGKANSPLAIGPHAWNIVKINGYYHHVDVTWDNQYADSAEIPNYGYLNLSDDEIAKDHTWNRKHYPQCPEAPYNYFKINNALLDSKAQLESFLYNSFMSEEEVIMFKVIRGSILEMEIQGCLNSMVQRAISRCKYLSIRQYRYGGIPEQLTFFVSPQYEYR